MVSRFVTHEDPDENSHPELPLVGDGGLDQLGKVSRCRMNGIIECVGMGTAREVTRTMDVVRRNLGDTIVAVYLYGSAEFGGLRPDSDLDFLIVVNEPVVGTPRRQLVDELLAISGHRAANGAARPIEATVVVLDDVVPWQFPPRRNLVYGEWLRDELEAGTIAPPILDPDLTILLTMVRTHSSALVGPAAWELLDPIPSSDLYGAIYDSLPSLLDGLRGDERNVILTLARMWVTLSTGRSFPRMPRRGGHMTGYQRSITTCSIRLGPRIWGSGKTIGATALPRSTHSLRT